MEKQLIPCTQTILQNNVDDLIPYSLQLLATLLQVAFLVTTFMLVCIFVCVHKCPLNPVLYVFDQNTGKANASPEQLQGNVFFVFVPILLGKEPFDSRT